jgi:hypothetical protein
LDCGGNVQTGWYLFVCVSILTLSTIFILDCGGNVQTGCYLFVRVSILPFLRFFYWIVVEMFRRGGIFCLFYILLITFNDDKLLMRTQQC